jgi:hypothetical protein
MASPKTRRPARANRRTARARELRRRPVHKVFAEPANLAWARALTVQARSYIGSGGTFRVAPQGFEASGPESLSPRSAQRQRARPQRRCSPLAQARTPLREGTRPGIVRASGRRGRPPGRQARLRSREPPPGSLTSVTAGCEWRSTKSSHRNEPPCETSPAAVFDPARRALSALAAVAEAQPSSARGTPPTPIRPGPV